MRIKLSAILSAKSIAHLTDLFIIILSAPNILALLYFFYNNTSNDMSEMLEDEAVKAVFDKGNEFYEKRDNKLALDYYNKGLRRFPSSIRMLSNRSAIHIHTERYNLALKDVDAVLLIDPCHIKFRYRSATIYIYQLTATSRSEKNIGCARARACQYKCKGH